MKTAPLPHGHTVPCNRRRIPLFLALAGCLFCLPLWAATPTAPATAEPASASASAAPAANAVTTTPAATVSAPTLPQIAPLIAPDNAPSSSPNPQTPASAATASTSTIQTLLQRAFTLLGTPYRYGGNTPETGFDCSGLVSYVFRTIGIDLPRVSRAMAHEGTRILHRDALAEGDLVFFGRRGRIDHVGIYIGNGQFLHAPRSGRDVTVSSLSDGYWASKYVEARRLAGN